MPLMDHFDIYSNMLNLIVFFYDSFSLSSSCILIFLILLLQPNTKFKSGVLLGNELIYLQQIYFLYGYLFHIGKNYLYILH